MEFIETMDEMTAPFAYEEFTTRNIGFVTEAQQAKLRDAAVFVCGTGVWEAPASWRWPVSE
jgi:hypothetical protein